MIKIFVLLIAIASAIAIQTEKPCRLRELSDGFVCVCNDDYCDTLEIPEPTSSNEWIFVTSSKSGDRFNYKIGEFQSEIERNYIHQNTTTIEIIASDTFQQIIGFGASFSGSVTYLLNKITKNMRECIYKSYYTSDFGLSYSLMRIPIGGCDFDLEPWAYNECPENDTELTNFTTLHPYDKQRVKLIKELMNTTQNFNIKMIAVAWSAPRWMKTEYRWDGKDKNQLRLEYLQTWADYHIKFLDLMSVANISFWALSAGNEPSFSTNLPFISMNWNPYNYSNWIVNYLIPALEQSKYSSIELQVFDDNRDTLLNWLRQMCLANKNIMNFVSTIAVHGYFDKETSPEIFDIFVNEFPNKTILYTEMCFSIEDVVSTIGPKIGYWYYAEDLTLILMEILSHHVMGYIDWNMILNDRGGPNYKGNIVDAAIIVNENYTEIYKQPMFYAMAHFSKFITSGAVRISTKISSGVDSEHISSLAFQRLDGKIALIMYNNHSTNTINVHVIGGTKGKAELQLKPKSINSFLYSI